MSKNDVHKLKVIGEVFSPINGRLLVTTNPLLGTNIITENKIAESGTIMGNVWRKCLVWLKSNDFHLKKCLILGFGAGTAAKLTHDLWPKSKIVGIEIDPVMIKLGKKYFGLTRNDAEIIIGDAHKEIQKLNLKKQRFDLILIDIFIEDRIPETFDSEEFFKTLLNCLSPNGVVIFNRLLSEKYSKDLKQTNRKLTKIFKNVFPIFTKRNVLLVCKNVSISA